MPECRVPPSVGAGIGGQEDRKCRDCGQEEWVVQVWDRQDEGMPEFGDARATWVPSEKPQQ